MTRLRLCPCGCGKELRPYNGVQPLVCYAIWQRVPHVDRTAIMFQGTNPVTRRTAVRHVLEAAHVVRQDRASRVQIAQAIPGARRVKPVHAGSGDTLYAALADAEEMQ